MVQYSVQIHSDANDATNFRFLLNEDLSQLCYYWSIFVDDSESSCNGYVLDFISQSDAEIKFVQKGFASENTKFAISGFELPSGGAYCEDVKLI